ncbi:MAG: WS/DGAT domain-containing protein [Candidatus Nanopelagicales bacterium]
MAGARVDQLVPFAPKGGAAMNVAFMSYNGKAEIGINLDAAIYDHDVMVRCLKESLAQVLATVPTLKLIFGGRPETRRGRAPSGAGASWWVGVRPSRTGPRR